MHGEEFQVALKIAPRYPVFPAGHGKGEKAAMINSYLIWPSDLDIQRICLWYRDTQCTCKATERIIIIIPRKGRSKDSNKDK